MQSNNNQDSVQIGKSSVFPLSQALQDASSHFLYITEQNVNMGGVEALLVEAVMDYIEKYGIRALEIALLEKMTPYGPSEKLYTAFELLCSLFMMDPRRTSVVFCEKAIPHTDDRYLDVLFRSAVLHTGNEEGYVVGCISPKRNKATEKEARGNLATNIQVNKGDVFLLNPQHIHYAMSLGNSEDSLLIMLQEDISDVSLEDRLETYKIYPFKPESQKNVDSFV